MKLILTAAIMCLLLIDARAQDMSAATTMERIDVTPGEFSIALPGITYADREIRGKYQKFKLVSFFDGIQFELTHYVAPLAELRDLARVGVDTQFRRALFNGFAIVYASPDPDVNAYRFTIDDRTYELAIVGAADTDRRVARVLGTVRLKGEGYFDYPPDLTIKIVDRDLKMIATSPEVLAAFSVVKPDRDPKVTFPKIATIGADISERLDRCAVILERPIAIASTETVVGKRGPWSAVLRIGLRADGQVGDIEVLETPSKAYGRICARAASKIRFIPAMKDGKPVDSVLTIRYVAKLRVERYFRP
jgi:hypothetical protein